MSAKQYIDVIEERLNKRSSDQDLAREDVKWLCNRVRLLEKQIAAACVCPGVRHEEPAAGFYFSKLCPIHCEEDGALSSFLAVVRSAERHRE